MAKITVPRHKDRGRQKDQENGQYAGSREGWPRDRRRERYRSMYDDGGLCTVVSGKSIVTGPNTHGSLAPEITCTAALLHC
jgi:hypothetical protein